MQEASLFDAIMLYLDFGHKPREKALNRAAMKLTRLHMFSLWCYDVDQSLKIWQIVSLSAKKNMYHHRLV